MSGTQNKTSNIHRLKSDSTFDKVAAHALSEVASRVLALKQTPDAWAIDMLFDAATGSDPLACSRVAHELIDKGISAERICDVFIPSIARRMGDDWCTDEMSFSNVTIGSARLQFLLREIGPGHTDKGNWADDATNESVLLLLAKDVDHTLGVSVLANQLRRRGYSVKLSIGEDAETLMQTLTSGTFAAIFLSACRTDDLDGLKQLVDNIKMTLKKPAPIILGGYIVEEKRDALTVTGVDKVTSKLDEALEFCSLNRP
jgi:methanogenic corrinoid protein MtbC1